MPRKNHALVSKKQGVIVRLNTQLQTKNLLSTAYKLTLESAGHACKHTDICRYIRHLVTTVANLNVTQNSNVKHQLIKLRCN